jgi:hypothetical protein
MDHAKPAPQRTVGNAAMIESSRSLAARVAEKILPISFGILAMARLEAVAADSPFFNIDPKASGPLTLEELQLSFSEDFKPELSDENRACAVKKIASLAEEAGDPETADMVALGYLPESYDYWSRLGPSGRRYLLGQLIMIRGVSVCARRETDEPPFYRTDPNATGPLTLDELQIRIPEEIDKQLSDKNRACALKKIAELAEEAGDPETVDMVALGYLSADFDGWEKLRPYGRRGILGQAIVSRGFALCTPKQIGR